MLKIGDFSALTQVTVKTLRFYDESGLLPPVHVDMATGYRYYSVSQLPRLHRILALKDLGFSLDQIAKALNAGVTPGELRGMLMLREVEQEARVSEELQRLTRLRVRLKLIEQEGKMNADVVIKDVAPQWIASIRETIPNYPSVGKLYGELFGALGTNGAGGLPVARWHDLEYKENDVDAEAAVYLKTPIPASGRIQVYQLPATTVASTIHHGAYNRLNEAYDALLKWVAANGFRVAGPIRELYLQVSAPVRQDDDSYVTELQVPVAKTE